MKRFKKFKTMNTQHKSQPKSENEFLESILHVAQDLAGKAQLPNNTCIDRSHTINNIRVNVVVQADQRPGFLRRILGKVF